MRRSPAARCGAVLVALTLVLAVLGPWVWGAEAARFDPMHTLEGHSSAHWLGTDDGGRDMLARTLAATRLSVLLAALATALGAVLGVTLGALPSVLGERAARFVTAVVNGMTAIPVLLLAMFAALVAGTGTAGAVVGIGVASAPGLARLTRTLAAGVESADYVAAARMLGTGRVRVLTRHILPNIAEPLILSVTAALGYALLGMATLSLLGLGVQPPDYDWGRLLHDALPRVYVDPEVIAGPALAVAVAGIGFTLVGESLARAAARTPVPPGAGKGAELPLGPASRPGLSSASEAVLEVRDLTVFFGGVTPVRGVSFTVASGEVVGIVGESGSGKSLTALAVGGLVPYPGRVRGDVLLEGKPLGELSRKELGTRLAMVFQDPLSALNPALRVGTQLAETATVHLGMTRREARARAVARLERTGVAAERVSSFPHELSGGMRQRAVIAMGLMGDPRLIVADEPTTALDTTVQRKVLDLLGEVVRDTGAGAVLISHDIAVVSSRCDRVLVMYAGRVVEEVPADRLRKARHPYTRALVASIPDLGTDRSLPLASIPGAQPVPSAVGEGCAFADRCGFADEVCLRETPALVGGVACHHPSGEGAVGASKEGSRDGRGEVAAEGSGG
ncbi:dipeptide/oligopeptide/nickel ABC transporter permease/ATP-binding protein [Actinocorallia sp. A-T 12471]|uniref:dipeptide/oligopeptide/nickel ABC transporter permease/ATP-binding protein n=1 Tax=Actinocorallia sp. A-T 12471 TaxID=3089813 RepID=UPI0029D20A3B|nr:dipeptide/oligopeptide/nickel ABC transporter permease/ATP-binding protein [Actinocorallia sp. A-T 12471]MDX6743580.1 dipeptide/oligopeptide/nickel ABC transporter permease/ATP-binding protein [Actinocorallia sp. A-T 12471]